MRSFRDLETTIQFVNGFLVFYNYIRPHEALEGKTPAEVAKVNYDVKNWADVCRIPVSKQAEVVSYRKPRMPKARVELPRTQIGRPRKRKKTRRHTSSGITLSTGRRVK
jgi:hypothetical protein